MVTARRVQRMIVTTATVLAMASAVQAAITVQDVLGTLNNVAYCRRVTGNQDGEATYTWAPTASKSMCFNSPHCVSCEWVVHPSFVSDEAMAASVAQQLATLREAEQGTPATLALIKIQSSQTVKTAAIAAWQEEAGASFGSVIPTRHGMFFRTILSASQLERVRAMTGVVEDAIPLPSELKMSPDLQLALQREQHVHLKLRMTPPAVRQLLAATPLAAHLAGVTVHGANEHQMTLHSVPVELARSTLAQHPHTSWMEPARKFKTLNKESRWLTQSGVLNQAPVWAHGLHGEGEIVGCADSGVDTLSCFFNDPNHPIDIQGDQTYENPAHRTIVQYVPYADGIEGEEDGHGTHVAGTILGEGGRDHSTFDGMAKAAKLAFFDMGIAGNPYLMVPNDLAEDMFPHAYRLGARVHSNSWGGDQNAYTLDSREVDQFSYEHQDMLIVFAAGNDGVAGPGSVNTPATAKNCLSVGASLNADQMFASMNRACPVNGSMPCQNHMAYFSSTGPTSDGRMKPEVVAPGYYVLSAKSLAAPTAEHCNVVHMPGTSMAAPVVAGNAALIRQYLREGWFPSRTKSNGNALQPMGALLKAMLVHSAVPLTGMYGDQPLNATPTNVQGFGRVQLNRVLMLDDSPFDLFLLGDMRARPVVDNGEDMDFHFTVTNRTGGGPALPFRVTLVWHDPPADTGAQPALVNNLDLAVITPSGQYLLPNGAHMMDMLNNVEQVEVMEPEVGNYTVRVEGNIVPLGPQPFSLVVSGSFVRSRDLFAPYLPTFSAAPSTVLPAASRIIVPGIRFPSDARVISTHVHCGGHMGPSVTVAASSASALVLNLAGGAWTGCAAGATVFGHVTLAGYEQSLLVALGTVQPSDAADADFNAALAAMAELCSRLDTQATCGAATGLCSWHANVSSCVSSPATRGGGGDDGGKKKKDPSNVLLISVGAGLAVLGVVAAVFAWWRCRRGVRAPDSSHSTRMPASFREQLVTPDSVQLSDVSHGSAHEGTPGQTGHVLLEDDAPRV